VFTESNGCSQCCILECQEEAHPFNPQILTANSGAANAHWHRWPCNIYLVLQHVLRFHQTV
jgi:hypothetical protein